MKHVVKVTVINLSQGDILKNVREIQSNKKCRFGKICAYKHSTKIMNSSHNSVYDAMASINIKHDSEIAAMKKETYR